MTALITPRSLTAPLALLLLASAAAADEVQLGAEKDNTLYEDAAGALSNGAGTRVFVGNTGQSSTVDTRRGLFEFDVAGAVPAGSTVTGVVLRLRLVTSNSSGNTDLDAHVVLAEWGEAGSDAPMGEGGGAPAQPGDATWLHTSFPGSFWSTAGGDYVAASSATTPVGTSTTFYEWSSAQMVADVQTWLDSPSQNHGWILIGDEAPATSARAFSSREATNSADRPLLTVTYDPPGGGAFCFGSGCPCNNDDPAAGCANSTAQGALLGASGTASLSNDSLVLAVTQTTNQPGVFFQGNVALNPAPQFGDGFRCCGQSVIRIGVYLPSGNATDTQSGNLIGGVGAPISDHPGNGNLMAGDSRCYQWWYRDPGAGNPCQSDFFNLSNGVQFSWSS